MKGERKAQKLSAEQIAEMARALDHASMAAMELENRSLKAENSRLKSSRDRLLEALKPFAAFAENDGAMGGKGDELYLEHGKVNAALRRSDCVKARAAIKAAEAEGE